MILPFPWPEGTAHNYLCYFLSVPILYWANASCFELALFLDSWSNISKLGWEENIFFANNGSGYPYELIYYWIYTWTESLSIKWEVSLYYSICSYHCIKGISSKVPAFFSTILNIISCWTSSVRLMNCYAESFYYLSLLLTDLNRYYMKSRCANLLV